MRDFFKLQEKLGIKFKEVLATNNYFRKKIALSQNLFSLNTF